jgi:hypothetical protein
MIPRNSSLITTLLAALALMGSAALSPLKAQELPRSFASLRYAPTTDTAVPHIPLQVGDSTSIPKTYWLEGALVVGTVFAILAGTLAGGLCADPDSGGGHEPCWDDALLGGAVGFAAGGSLGALIGGQFKKRRARSVQPDSASAEADTSATFSVSGPQARS